MKKKDIISICLLAFVSMIISLVLSSFLISSAKNRNQKVEVVDAITSEFKEPNQAYFNNNSVNPTLPIQIGDKQNNPQPFSE